jgi:hypothetical protein
VVLAWSCFGSCLLAPQPQNNAPENRTRDTAEIGELGGRRTALRSVRITLPSRDGGERG